MRPQVQVIVMAAGPPVEINSVRKQLLPVDGEPVLWRTLRQLYREGVINPPVIAADGLSVPEGTLIYPPAKSAPYMASQGTDTLWSRSGLTVLLLGDVYYSDDAIRRILRADPTKYTFWCRYGYNPDASLGGGEGWAVTFGPDQHGKLRRILRSLARRAQRAGTTYHWWQLDREWHSAPIDIHQDFGDAEIIDDCTEDFDSKEAYERWLVANNHNAGGLDG